MERVQGEANMEMTTSKFNTALLLAVNNGQTPLIELLVNQGNRLYICMCYLTCFVSLKSQTQNTCMHAHTHVYTAFVQLAFFCKVKLKVHASSFHVASNSKCHEDVPDMLRENWACYKDAARNYYQGI